MILRNLLVGLPAMLVCLVIQVSFAFWCIRYYVRHSIAINLDAPLLSLKPLLVAMLIMMLGTLIEVALWGLLFVFLGEFDEFYEFYEAVYHSAVNFASLGYGDIVMSRPWKLLGPLEALCGVLMLGLNAAALMAILQHMIKSQREDLGLL